MNKRELLERLRKGLEGLPEEELEEQIAFYSEMIDDRMEDGISEEEAVSEIGNPEDIIAQIVADTPLTKLVKEKLRPKKKLKVWKIVLLVLGSPVWLPILLVAAAVVFALYICLWAILISLWSVFAAVAACALSGVAAGIAFIVHGNGLTGAASIAAGLICAGLCIFAFFGCRAASKGILKLTKKFAIWIKNRFMKKEEV